MRHLPPTSGTATSGERDATQPQARDQAERSLPNTTNRVNPGEAEQSFGLLTTHVGAGRHGEDVTLPEYIWMLHGNAIVHSVKDGTPGYTTDDRLRELCAGHNDLRQFAPRLDEMVAQLCRVEMWKREGDRYEMHAELLLPLAIQTFGKKTENNAD